MGEHENSRRNTEELKLINALGVSRGTRGPPGPLDPDAAQQKKLGQGCWVASYLYGWNCIRENGRRNVPPLPRRPENREIQKECSGQGKGRKGKTVKPARPERVGAH